MYIKSMLKAMELLMVENQGRIQKEKDLRAGKRGGGLKFSSQALLGASLVTLYNTHDHFIF